MTVRYAHVPISLAAPLLGLSRRSVRTAIRRGALHVREAEHEIGKIPLRDLEVFCGRIFTEADLVEAREKQKQLLTAHADYRRQRRLQGGS